jgi:oxygen-independent coproporphyrinogen-3 oxidase
VPVPHLYVHVPFCARRCSYCDFSIAVRSATPVEEYLDATRKELGGLTHDIANSVLDTVYFGGGTPSRLGGNGVSDLLGIIRDHTQVAAGAEITLEANPDDVNDVAVAHWVAAEVNRVSLGSQSFDSRALDWMHRTHNSGQIGTAVATLRRGGITNISLDLIFALPSHLNRSWKHDLEKALELTPNHLSLYGLTVEAQTPIARWADRGASVQGSEEEYEEEFLEAHSVLCDAGFEHYEVSNFARPGFRSHHNSAYWTGAAYVGVGPSAHSFDGSTRRWNVSAYSEWVRRLASGETVIAGAESLTSENRDAEEVYLGLRTNRGLGVSETHLSTVRRWEAAGWAILDDPLDQPRIRLTPSGWLRLDSLAAELAARRARLGTSGLGATPSHCYI